MKKMKEQSQGGFLMAKIRHVGGRISERLIKQYDIEINNAQGRIMFSLWKKDSIPINELAKKTQLKKSTLTSMLDRLENMGYVKRVRSKKDRRKILIKRTKKDKTMEKKYVEVSEEMTRLFYKGFSENQINRFEKDLEQILNNLTEFETNMDQTKI
ncbi:MAG: MarR family transcriptional regulator [Sedimentisphaerales bacterium]|nr:MarR family transcriptional regulator [Sedimentisphaerales bacterium]